MKKFADVAALNKEIAAIKVAGAKLDSRIQTAAVAVLEHFAQHHDNGLVNRLYHAMPAGSRKAALTSWLLTHCAVSANTDKATKQEQPFVYDRNKKTDPEAGEVDLWYNHKPDKAPTEVFDLQKAVRALLAKAGRAESIKGGDADTLKSLAAAVGIPESDVPVKHNKTANKTAEKTNEKTSA